MRNLTARRVQRWYRVHKYTSLVCTAFLLMACITGLPLIFHEELEPLLHHEVRPAESPANAPNASLDTMLLRAEQRFPVLHPYAIAFDDDEPRVFVTLTPTPKPEKFQTVIFDRHTGQFLETGAPGTGLLAWILQLHREIFAGLPGELLLAAMAVLFVISLLSGALVYGPFMRRLEFGTFRREAAGRVRWFDLHNLTGIVALAWGSVVGITGAMNALSTPLFGLWRMQVVPPLLAPYRGQPMPAHYGTVDGAVEAAARALPDFQVSSILFPNAIVASPRHYVVWTKGKTPVTSRLFTPALIDAESGKVTMTTGLPWYLRTLEVCRPLHFGDYGGLPLKILWACFDAVLIAVLGSGLYLWVRKKSDFESRLTQAVRSASDGGLHA